MVTDPNLNIFLLLYLIEPIFITNNNNFVIKTPWFSTIFTKRTAMITTTNRGDWNNIQNTVVALRAKA